MTEGTSCELERIAELEAQCELLRAECERLKRQRDEARSLVVLWERIEGMPPAEWEP